MLEELWPEISGKNELLLIIPSLWVANEVAVKFSIELVNIYQKEVTVSAGM